MTLPSPGDVTLQINLAPTDWRVAQHVLPHQVSTWRDQVSEILLTVDLHKSSGRFGANWEEGRDRIMALAHSVEGARVAEIDYGAESQRRVSAEFFGGAKVPAKDFRGGPYYAYFFGLNASKNSLVLHTDSDILFGGRSPTWMSEAVGRMRSDPSILVMAPNPGPPADDGRLKQLRSSVPGDARHVHRMDNMSTRVFLLDRVRFRERIGRLSPSPPAALRSRIKALVEGNPAADLPEHLFTERMQSSGLFRVDFLGDSPGMWTLHPPYRCADFFEKLPTLVKRVEDGEIPEGQRGDHDINESLVDWSEAKARLARNRWWRRLASRW